MFAAFFITFILYSVCFASWSRSSYLQLHGTTRHQHNNTAGATPALPDTRRCAVSWALMCCSVLGFDVLCRSVLGFDVLCCFGF